MKLNSWIRRTLEGFGVFNLAIGITLFFWHPVIPFTVISPIIKQTVWAGIFLASGLFMFFGLLTNRLKLLRYLMIFGLFIKMAWEIGLLIRIRDGGTAFLVELWGMIAYLQLLGVIYFNPEDHYGNA